VSTDKPHVPFSPARGQFGGQVTTTESSLRALVAVVETSRIWMTPESYADTMGISTRTLLRMELAGHIPAASIHGTGKGKRYWRFFDPHSGSYLFGLMPPEQSRPLTPLGRPRGTTKKRQTEAA